MTDDISDTQSALPFRTTGFFIKFLIVLMTRPAMLGHLSVSRE